MKLAKQYPNTRRRSSSEGMDENRVQSDLFYPPDGRIARIINPFLRPIVRFLVRFFRVVDGGRAKSEIKQQRKREGERETTSDEVKFNRVWLEIRELLSDPEYGSRNSVEKALENTTRWKKRERETLTRLLSILLDQSSFPCLRLIYRGAIDLVDPPPSFTWILSLEKKLYHGVYIRSILVISEGGKGGNAEESC